jgi:DNA-binding NtrC family response regulator
MTLPEEASQSNNAIRNRIAVVFHEYELADIFAKIIRETGFEVDVFTSSRVASEKIGSEHSIYSLVVTGWRMRGITGPELGYNLSKLDPGIKIILISAYDFEMEYYKIGDFKFQHFRMPVDSATLLEVVNNKIKNGK